MTIQEVNYFPCSQRRSIPVPGRQREESEHRTTSSLKPLNAASRPKSPQKSLILNNRKRSLLSQFPQTLFAFRKHFLRTPPPTAKAAAKLASSICLRLGLEPEPVDMEKKEGDGQGGPHRGQGAQEAPVPPGPPRPVHPLPRVPLAQVRSCRRSR
jgi:hypothetical protein